MTVFVHVVVAIAGSVTVVSTLLSAVRTIVLPHGRSARLTRYVFRVVRGLLGVHHRISRNDRRRAHVRSLYAPVALVLLPLIWLTTTLAGFTAVFWALGTHPLRAAFKLAGSSMLTLGFSNVDDLPRLAVSFFAAALTIAVLALLLVTYLPTMYQAYSSRETALTGLETYAGEPPAATELLIRVHRIGGDDLLSSVWTKWQQVLFEIRESHTALPAVVLFSSSTPGRHWVTSVEAILDAAALYNSACRVEQDPTASLCVRAGRLALVDIAEFFGYPIDPDPRPDDPISIDRATFDHMRNRLAAAGIPLPVDPDEAWTRWSGWRVNYDAALFALYQVNPPTRPSRARH